MSKFIILFVVTALLGNSIEFSQSEYHDVIKTLLKPTPNISRKIEYYVYTYTNPILGEQILPDVESVIRTPYNPLVPTTFFIPRRNDLYSCPENSHIVPGKLSLEESNVIVVDYSAAANGEYADAVSAVPDVGAAIAQFIMILHRHFDIPLSKFHVVGFDLGAQIAGLAGQFIQQQLGQKLPRITALDPVGELFDDDHTTDNERLSSDDAQFVEVIHTNAGHIGIQKAIGHADYYPNGGQTQPDCPQMDDECSHERVYLFVYEMWSDSNEFVSAKCGNINYLNDKSCNYVFVKMGQLDNSTARGIFYLKTNGNIPFARGAPATFL